MKDPALFRHFAATLALALTAPGCVINVDADQAVVREERRFPIGEGADVTLETFDGSIKVQSWDQAEVLVEVQKRGPDREAAAALEVKSTQEGNRVRVEAPEPRSRRHFIGIGNVSSPSVSFVVTVPRHVKLTARTGDGSITIEQVTGTIALNSGDGSITAEGTGGALRARTGDGSVRIVDVNGRVSLESGDGSIHVEGRMEDLHAETRDGSIVIEATDGTTMKTDWGVSTGDGSIVFRVPETFNAEIDANSGDGSVRSEVAGLETHRSENGRESLRGRLGTGGHVVKLRSGDGSIRVVNR